MVTYLNENGVTTKPQGFGPGNRGGQRPDNFDGQRPENFDGQKFRQNPPGELPDKSQERMAPPQ